MKKFITAVLGILLYTGVMHAQSNSAYTIRSGDRCNGQNPDGAWLTNNTWHTSGGLSTPPEGHWQGNKIIIKDNIIICNNDDIDLSNSNVDTLIIRSGSSLNYRANSTLILPANTVIIMEENSFITVSNQSQGTLLQIGNDSIWGKEILCTIEIDGPRVITNDTRICEENILLPVELLSFNADTIGSTIMLTWVTLSEINTDYYEIQHSLDAVNWKNIEVVDASGFSSQAKLYSWTHNNPVKAVNYYRIRQVDQDGEFMYFPIISASLKSNWSHTINNPINDQLHLSIHSNIKKESANLYSLKIVNLNGTSVYKENLSINEGTNNFQFNLSHLKGGIYFIKVFSGTNQIISDKVIKW